MNLDNVVLVGFMGSGKTSIGRLLAQYKKSFFIDSDALISLQENSSVEDIFKKKGEEYFRSIEGSFALWIKQSIKNSIISLGGGFPIYSDIHGIGTIVYLKCDFETIYKRCEKFSTRPLLKDKDSSYELFCKREPAYKRLADFVINANLKEKEVLQSIIKLL